VDNDGLKRLQEIARRAAEGQGRVATGLPTPPTISLQQPSAAATPVVLLNRMQRRRGKAATGTRKRSHRDHEVHAYAERIRHMTDQQIWDWGHRGDA